MGDQDTETKEVHARRPYLPVKGSAWRLVLADTGADGRGRLVYGAYDGAVRCCDPETGELEWEVTTDAFPFSLAAYDIDRDGRDEILAACADGALHAIGPDGTPLWTFRSTLPLYAVAAGRLFAPGEPGVVCGGIDRQVYLLSSEGEVVGSHEVGKLVHRLAVGDLDGDGRDEILVVDARIRAEALEAAGGGLRRLWRKELSVPADRKNWENPGGHFYAFSVDLADVDADGRAEIAMGDVYFNKQAVMLASPEGEPVWLSDSVPWTFEDGRCTEFYSTAFVEIADVCPDRAGREVVSVAGGLVRLFAADGELLGRALARVGFTDLAVDGETLYLGSSPNGDETIYRVSLTDDWVSEVEALERRGIPRAVGSTIAGIREQVLEAEDLTAGGRTHDVKMLGVRRSETGYAAHCRKRDWLREQFPYDNLRFVAGTKVIEPTPPLDENDEPWSERRWRTDSINGTMTVEEIVEAARWVEEHEVPTVFLIGHSCMPFVTLETAEKMLRAAPNYLVGFLSAEDEQIERIPRYFKHYFGPLADLCAEHGGKRCMTKNKNVWWMSAPSMGPVFREMFSGRRKEVLGAAVEDSNSRTPEINLLARFGLWMAGLIDGFEVSIHSDLFSFCRFHQWEYPKHGHPYLRLLVAHTLLGGDSYTVRVKAMRRDGDGFAFSDIGRESVEAFLHLLGKGLVFPPEREQVAGMSPVGIATHRPPQKWLEDGHNGHNPDRWRDDPELHAAVLPHNGCLWGNTPTPAHALQRVLLGKSRQFGWNVPATPYGPFVIVPAHADLQAVPCVEEWWHTDGVYLWREGGPKLAGEAAAEAVRSSFRRAAARLPFRGHGHVFFQVLRMDETTYRLYAIDPGWLTPADREVVVSVPREGRFAVQDLLSGDDLPVRNGRIEFTVPAGALRILEARRT